MTIDGKIVKIPCGPCGGGRRNHAVLAEHVISWRRVVDAEGDEDSGEDSYQICKCLGCDTVRFRNEYWSRDEDFNRDTGAVEPNENIYPEIRSERDPMLSLDVDLYPANVSRIYLETVRAYHAEALILAGAGLRAIIEALCIEAKAPKIDELVTRGLLAKAQANLLHEGRLLGNAALHTMIPPSPDDIEAGLMIVEGLLNTIYVLPGHGERLRRRRQKKVIPLKEQASPEEDPYLGAP